MKLRLLPLLVCLAVFPNRSRAQWEAPQKLSQDTAAALTENMGQCLAVSGDNVHVLWEDNKVDHGAIFYRHSFDGGITWSTIVRLTPPTQAAGFPSIAVWGSTVHIAYRDTNDSISYYLRSLDGGNTWDNPVALGNYYWWPSITCSGTMVFVALNSDTPGNSEVWFRRSLDNGTTWDPVVRISSASGRSEDPSIAASGGAVHLAWNDNRTGIMQTWYRRSTDSGVTWGPETQLTNTTASCYFPILHALDSMVDLAYGDRQTGNYEIYFKQSTDFGASWQPSLQMTHVTGTEAYPNIACGGKNIDLVWWLFTGDAYIQHSGDAGVTWDSALTLVPGVNKPTNPFIVISGTSIHTIWIDQRDGHYSLYYMRNPTGVLNSINAGVNTQPSEIQSMQVSPNPAYSTAVLYINAKQPLDNVSLELYDDAGKLRGEQIINRLEAGSSSISLTLPAIDGMAFIRVVRDGTQIGVIPLAILR